MFRQRIICSSSIAYNFAYQQNSNLAGNGLHLYINIRSRYLATSPDKTGTVNKEALIRMRKETGYSYVKCRKALVKFGTNNYNEALQWIKESAKKEGWEKAAKLGVRIASQGLCALMSDKNVSVMIALNCETDFVANSSEFKDLLRFITKALYDYALSTQDINFEDFNEGKLNFVEISPKEFRINSDGITAEEAIISAIGKLGEKITLSSAKIIFAHPSISVIGSTHPNVETDGIQLGRFVSFIALRRNATNTEFSTEKLGRQICHHIIGMVPDRIGKPLVVDNMVEQNPQKCMTDETKTKEKVDIEDYDEDDDKETITRINEKETQLLRQAFMLNPRQTVHEYLTFHGAQVFDFMRMELPTNK